MKNAEGGSPPTVSEAGREIIGEMGELLERADAYLETIPNKGNVGQHHLVSDLVALVRSLASLTPATKPVAYLHRLRDAMVDPTLSFKIARNPQWTSEPLYTSPAQVGVANRLRAMAANMGGSHAPELLELASLLQHPAQEK